MGNEQNKNDLGRKLLFTGVALACVAGATAWWVLRSQNNASEKEPEPTGVESSKEDLPPFIYQLARMAVGERGFTLDIADTPGKMRLGLSEHDTIPTDEGMVFVYSSVSERCFWMQDMRIPIDIVWLNDERHITHIEQSLSPDTYPKTYCAEAQYVVELAAGTAKELGFKVGDTVDLSL